MARPAAPIHEYREAADLDEVNRLAVADGFDLFQAVAVEGQLRFILRRIREPEAGRPVGFSAATPGGGPGSSTAQGAGPPSSGSAAAGHGR